MPKQGTPTRRRAGATPLRDLLVAHWDHKMTYWRIEGHPYPFEQALKSGADVVVDAGRLADALAHAGQAADRFDNGGADAGRVWLLGADDTLTLIDDRHVADLGQREFDELVAGLGTSRTLAWDADDPQAAVAAYAALTAAIRVAMG
ncbi:MAG TPA: hypothetical protein VKG83_14630 [Mycobacterium sp.]|nr:hypothetical protein [Mycobacterium sp.]